VLWQLLAHWVPDPGHDPHAVVVAHRLRQVEHGLPLAVVGVDLAGGRTQPLHIRGEQVQLGLGMDGRDRTRLVAGITLSWSSLAWARVLPAKGRRWSPATGPVAWAQGLVGGSVGRRGLAGRGRGGCGPLDSGRRGRGRGVAETLTARHGQVEEAQGERGEGPDRSHGNVGAGAAIRIAPAGRGAGADRPWPCGRLVSVGPRPPFVQACQA